MMRLGTNRTTAPRLKRLTNIGSCQLQRWNQSEDERAEDCRDESEEKKGAVNGDGRESRNILRTKNTQQIDPPPCEKQTTTRAEAREQEAFAEKLRNDSGATRPKCCPNRDLALPGSGACEQKIGDVCASDQQNKNNSRENRDEGGPNVADQIVMQRKHALGAASV